MALKFFSIFLFCITTKVIAQDFSQQIKEAEAFYADGKYEMAIAKYEDILATSNKEAFEIYFNLGNAYFKSNNLPATILNYEKARKLNPQDEDLLFNLEIANQQVVDKFEAVPELGISKWYRSFIFSLRSNTWAYLSIVFFSLMLFTGSIFLYKSDVSIKRYSLIGSFIFLLFAGCSLSFSVQQKNIVESQIEAVVFAPNVTATSAPSERSTSLFVLHEGTKVKVIEEKDAWVRIKISDGNIGWLEAEHVKMI
ncbi:MAG: SH3 domain-containing protein [Bacteroidota bacterium]